MSRRSIGLSLLNTSGEDVWIEVHSGDELQPVMRATRPLGPFSSKDDVTQRVGAWQGEDSYVVFLFRRLPHNVESYYRMELVSDETLLIPPVGQMHFVGANYRVGGPLPSVVRWITFALFVALPIVAIVAFALYKTFSSPKATTTNGGSGGGDSGGVFFDDDIY